jgi:hypothetical protein
MNAMTNITVSKTLAPEDLSIGTYVSVSRVVREFTNVLAAMLEPSRPLTTLTWTEPPERAEPPLRVVEVCLPYVLAEDPLGRPRTLDVRATRLARVSERFGEAAFERYRAERERRKKESSGEGPAPAGDGGGRSCCDDADEGC